MNVVFTFVFFSSRRRHTRCALVTGVQTCALPISVALQSFDERLAHSHPRLNGRTANVGRHENVGQGEISRVEARLPIKYVQSRSEEHKSELQRLMRITYAVFCLKKKKSNSNNIQHDSL